MKVQEFVLTEPYSWDTGPHDKRSLPAGAFVKPVEECYVPPHVKEQWRSLMAWNDQDYIYAYSYYGFLVLPRKLLRQA